MTSHHHHRARCLILALALACLATSSCRTTQHPERRRQPEPAPGCPAISPLTENSWGLVWMGPESTECAAAAPDNPFYDPSRPTVLFIHGWQNGGVARGFHQTLYFYPGRFTDEATHASDPWIEGGWNVGIFRWTQMADEPEVRDAEAKIWTTQGPQGMRWRHADGHHEAEGGAPAPIGELFYEAVLEAMGADFRGPRLRIVGHSLGSQPATILADQLRQAVDAGELDEAMRPSRLALLDPFWSKGAESYLDGQTNAEVCLQMARQLAEDGAIVELYKSSNINDFWVGDANEPLRELAAFVDVWPDYLTRADQAERHASAIYHYFASLRPQATCPDPQEVALEVASPAMRERMGPQGYLEQVTGRATRTLEDDCYRWEP